MFIVPDGKYLTIIGNETGTLTLNGSSGGVQNFVEIESGGYFTLENGGILANNTATDGGAVYMNGGTFMMKGGIIANNTAYKHGGGVHMKGGIFTMSGGTIANNTATSGFGGGLSVDGDNKDVLITLSGNAKISNNTATNGGGVFMKGGNTEITLFGNAEISNNKAVEMSEGTLELDTGHGGGVHVDDGTFSISDSVIITNNKAEKDGGGVYVHFGGTFVMSGGEISDNTAATNGGGVCADTTGTTTGTFEMSGGTISGNKADTNGTGVYVGGVFNIQKSGTVNGVYLPKNKNITVIGYLNDDTKVTGIIPAIQQENVLVVDLAKVSEGYLSLFQLDDSVENFALKYQPRPTKGLVLTPTHTVTFNAD